MAAFKEVQYYKWRSCRVRNIHNLYSRVSTLPTSSCYIEFLVRNFGSSFLNIDSPSPLSGQVHNSGQQSGLNTNTEVLQLYFLTAKTIFKCTALYLKFIKYFSSHPELSRPGSMAIIRKPYSEKPQKHKFKKSFPISYRYETEQLTGKFSGWIQILENMTLEKRK